MEAAAANEEYRVSTAMSAAAEESTFENTTIKQEELKFKK